MGLDPQEPAHHWLHPSGRAQPCLSLTSFLRCVWSLSLRAPGRLPTAFRLLTLIAVLGLQGAPFLRGLPAGAEEPA